MSKQAAIQTKQSSAPGFTRSRTNLFERRSTLGPHLSIQREATATAVHPAAPSLVRGVVESPGRPLDPVARSSMEPRFGYDLSRVRVHTDDRAAESARAVNANAYTTGPHVVFGRGQYAPGSPSGQRLMAHELTHVVQQASGPVSATKAAEGLSTSHPSDRFERAARQSSIAATSTQDRGPQTGSAPSPLSLATRPLGNITVQRQDTSPRGPYAQQQTQAAQSSAGSADTAAKAGVFSAIFAGVSALEAIRQANYAGRQAEATEDPPVQEPTSGGLVANDVELPEVKGIDPESLKPHPAHEESTTERETITYPKLEGVPGSGETQNPRTITRSVLKPAEPGQPEEQETRFLILRLTEGTQNSAEFWMTLRYNSKDVKGGTTEQGEVKGYLGGTLNSNASVNFRASPGAPVTAAKSKDDAGAATVRLLFGGTNVPARKIRGSTGTGVLAFLTGGLSGSGGSTDNKNYKVQRFTGSVRFTGKGTGAIDNPNKDIRVSPKDREPDLGDGKTQPFVTVSLNAPAGAAPAQQTPPPPGPEQQKAGGGTPAGGAAAGGAAGAGGAK